MRIGSQDWAYLHTLVGGQEDRHPIVCMSGYGGGSGMWFKNVAGLAAHFRVYAVDWLGTGLSGRPPFVADGREETEAFFVESLARWREEMKVGAGWCMWCVVQRGGDQRSRGWWRWWLAGGGWRRRW